MVTSNTKQKEKISINHVEEIVIEEMGSTWQTFDQQNDLAIDGILFLAKHGHQTGHIVYVQVKTGKSYFASEDNDHLYLKFTSKHLRSWKAVWATKEEPVVLVYVRNRTDIYWVDVKDPSIFIGKTRVRLSKRQSFNSKAKSKLVRLCRPNIADKNIPKVDCKKRDRNYLYKRLELKEAAKGYYDHLKQPASIHYKNVYFADTKFSRLGWNHITSPKRSSIRIRHSLELLGVVKLLLETISSYYVLKVKKTGPVLSEYLGMKAMVNFEERAAGVVQVVFVRRREFLPDGTYQERKWFLSVHEIKKD